MLRRINEILPELILEILVYGLLVQVVGMWFAADRWFFTIGLWIGIGIAMGMAIHMATVIRDALDAVAEKQAKTRTTIFSVLRYIIVVLLFAIVLFFSMGRRDHDVYRSNGLKVCSLSATPCT